MSTIEFTESFQSSERSSLRSGDIAQEFVNISDGGLRILLADDTEINRQLVIHLLENHGHAVVVAANGREAVEALEHRQFDVVLMDVQMPEMDGFDATAFIREKERGTGAHIPIIAMTAHAMKRDRERCLAAGMDGYVSKPIRPKALFQAIDEVVLHSAPSAKTTRETFTISQESAGPAKLDLPALLDSVNNKPALLSTLVVLFLKHYPKILTEIRDSIDQGDGNRLARAAHTLRGGSGGFLTGSVRTALTGLEAMAKIGCANQGGATLAQIETEMRHIEELLTGFVTEVGS